MSEGSFQERSGFLLFGVRRGCREGGELDLAEMKRVGGAETLTGSRDWRRSFCGAAFQIYTYCCNGKVCEGGDL